MKILVVSDTHGHDENLMRALQRELPIDALIHCGDLEGSEEYIPEAVECPCYFVRGNNDFFSDLPKEEEFTLGNYRDPGDARTPVRCLDEYLCAGGRSEKQTGTRWLCSDTPTIRIWKRWKI